jgi:hypothetical protein
MKSKEVEKSFGPNTKRERSIDSVIDICFNTMEALENGKISPFVARSMAQNAAVAVASFRCLMDQERLTSAFHKDHGNKLLLKKDEHYDV